MNEHAFSDADSVQEIELSNGAVKWADHLAERYVKPLDGHLETL